MDLCYPSFGLVTLNCFQTGLHMNYGGILSGAARQRVRRAEDLWCERESCVLWLDVLKCIQSKSEGGYSIFIVHKFCFELVAMFS